MLIPEIQKNSVTEFTYFYTFIFQVIAFSLAAILNSQILTFKIEWIKQSINPQERIADLLFFKKKNKSDHRIPIQTL